MAVLTVALAFPLASCRSIEGTNLPAEWRIPGSGITLSPPGTMTATVSADAAFNLCRIHVADCDEGDPTAVRLALMTDTGSNMVADGTLVWAISWLGTTSCGVSGGGNPWPATPAETPTPRCDKVTFIDARSNEFYFTITSRHE